MTNNENTIDASTAGDDQQPLMLGYAEAIRQYSRLGGWLKALMWYLLIKTFFILLGTTVVILTSATLFSVVAGFCNMILFFIFLYATARLMQLEYLAKQAIPFAFYAQMAYALLFRMPKYAIDGNIGDLITIFMWTYIFIADLAIPVCWLMYVKKSERVVKTLRYF